MISSPNRGITNIVRGEGVIQQVGRVTARMFTVKWFLLAPSTRGRNCNKERTEICFLFLIRIHV